MKIVYLLAIAAVAMAFFLFGRLTAGKSQKVAAASTSEAARIEKLPEDPWLLLEGAKASCASIGINRNPALTAITRVQVYNIGKSRLTVEFFEPDGHVKTIFFSNSGLHAREWNFRENGAVENDAIFEEDGRHGLRSYYNEEGVKIKEVRVVKHGT